LRLCLTSVDQYIKASKTVIVVELLLLIWQ